MAGGGGRGRVLGDPKTLLETGMSMQSRDGASRA